MVLSAQRLALRKKSNVLAPGSNCPAPPAASQIPQFPIKYHCHGHFAFESFIFSLHAYSVNSNDIEFWADARCNLDNTKCRVTVYFEFAVWLISLPDCLLCDPELSGGFCHNSIAKDLPKTDKPHCHDFQPPSRLIRLRMHRYREAAVRLSFVLATFQNSRRSNPTISMCYADLLFLRAFDVNLL